MRGRLARITSPRSGSCMASVAALRDDDVVHWAEVIEALLQHETATVLSTSEGSTGSNIGTDAGEVHQKLHHFLELQSQRERLEVLSRTEDEAALVLKFLFQRLSEQESQEVAATDIGILFKVPSYRDAIQRSSQQELPETARYQLARAGVQLCVSDAAATSFLYDAEHQQTARTVVQNIVQDTTAQLLHHGARILILGDRGAGKSSLCNAAFGNAVASAGAGLPVTEKITLYPATDACPIHIYDTKGFETLDGDETALEQLKQLIAERRDAANKYEADDPDRLKEQLHVVWWVIDVLAGGRFRPSSIHKVYQLCNNDAIPVIMVLNKCDTHADFVHEVQSQVREHCPWARGVVLVAAEPSMGPLKLQCEHCSSDDICVKTKQRVYSCDACGSTKVQIQPSYGVGELMKMTVEVLPDMVANSFLRAQNAWLEGLDKAATATIAAFAAGALIVGCSPVPFSARLLLIPLQVLMVVTLAAVYRVDKIFSRRMALTFCMSIFCSTPLGWGGYLASNLLKMVPGLNAVGMVSDAAIASSMTTAMGLVAMKLLRRVRGKALLGEVVQPEELAKIMSEEERQRLFRDYFGRVHQWSSGADDGTLSATELLSVAALRSDALAS